MKVEPPSSQTSREIVAWILSCPQRGAVLEKTLFELARTDWEDRLRIHLDVGEPTAAAEGNAVMRGHLSLLENALRGPGTHLLVLEDDITANLHLRHNLSQWELWQQVEEIHFATLYNPSLRNTSPFSATAAQFPPANALGAQARLFSRECAAHIVDNLRPSALRQDRQFAALASALGPLWLHRPSLVQHTGEQSTWGGPWHHARDFDEQWKC